VDGHPKMSMSRTINALKTILRRKSNHAEYVEGHQKAKIQEGKVLQNQVANPALQLQGDDLRMLKHKIIMMARPRYHIKSSIPRSHTTEMHHISTLQQ
jgi:hypothetical protein